MRLFELAERFVFSFRPAFSGDKRGVVAIEYGLLAAGISVVVAAAFFALGATLRTDYFDRIVAAFTG